MHIKSKLVMSLLAALALSASSAFAKKGADDGLPPQCDDHGTDLVVCNTIVAKHGADDPIDLIDDGGVDFIVAKNGADDLVDGFDDDGVDLVVG